MLLVLGSTLNVKANRTESNGRHKAWSVIIRYWQYYNITGIAYRTITFYENPFRITSAIRTGGQTCKQGEANKDILQTALRTFHNSMHDIVVVLHHLEQPIGRWAAGLQNVLTCVLFWRTLVRFAFQKRTVVTGFVWLPTVRWTLECLTVWQDSCISSTSHNLESI